MKIDGSCRKQASGERRKGVAVFKTRLGWAGVVVSSQGILSVILPRKEKSAIEKELESAQRGQRSAELSRPLAPGILKKAVMLLQKYFSGERVSFDVPLDIRYYTHFQRLVWRAVADIPYGETRAYAWIAERIGKPRAARAVGQAVGANPIPIMIP